MRVSWRRLIQFRLRTLLIVSVAVAVAVGLTRPGVLDALSQADAAADVYAQGGEVDVFASAAFRLDST